MNIKIQDKYGFAAENFPPGRRSTAKTVDFDSGTGNMTLRQKQMFAAGPRTEDGLDA